MTIPPEVNPIPALPKIEVLSDGNRFRIDWDYEEAPESRVLLNDQYLEGYIAGVITTLDIPKSNISCATARTGTIRRLPQSVALKLAELLAGVLHPAVTEEHRRMKYEANLPHIRAARAAAAAKSNEH